jgi:hypothetical protein
LRSSTSRVLKKSPFSSPGAGGYFKHSPLHELAH